MNNMLLRPAVLLLNNLRYPGRFALIGVVVISVVAWLTFTLVVHQRERLQSSRQELAALEIIKPVAHQIQLMQQHRGLSAGVLGGNTAMQASLRNKQAEVDAMVATVSQTLQQHAGTIPLTQEWQPLQHAWEQLKATGAQMSVAESFATHSQLLARLLAFKVDVADAGGMSGDPDLDTVYLIDTLVQRLPQLLERLGKLRARGTALLTQKQLDDATRVEISVHLALLEQVQATANTNLQKTIKAAPQLADVLTASSQELNTAINGLVQIIRNDVLAGQFTTEPAAYFKQATDTIDIGYRLSFEAMTPALEQQIQARIHDLERQMGIEIVLVSCLSVFMLYLFLGFYCIVMTTVARLRQATKAMSQGDLTHVLTLESRDELVQVADALNSMREDMTQLLRQILTSAHQVAQAASALVKSSSDVSASSQEQSSAAMSMAATVEQLTVSIDQIAEHARSAETSSRHSGELSGQSAAVVAGAADEMQNIANTVHRSSSIIQALGQNTEKISAIVGVIKEIADQTNLLALNAAIEAARAGEQGRGFAVVADEVRKLAERTAQSTQEISTMIATIQSGTEQAVASMQDGVARVEHGVAMSRQAGESIDQVRTGAHTVVQLVEEIAASLHQQSEASNDIARNVESIAQMSQENTAAVRDVATTVRQLEQLSFELDKLAQQFRLP